MVRIAGSLAIAWLVGTGCAGNHVNPPPTVTKVVSNQLDVLFVIENSLNTEDVQDLFAADFPSFVQALDAFPGGRPDLHVGVVTDTVGTGAASIGNCPAVAPDDDGLLVNAPRGTRNPGCQGPTDRYISDAASSPGSMSRTTNYPSTETLDQVVSCIADVSTTGCGIEQPLEGMKRALDGSRPENAGFLRPDAHLAVIFVGDEDDYSVADPAGWSLPHVSQLEWLYAYTCDQPFSTTAAGTYTNCHERDDSYLADTARYDQFLTSIEDPGQLVVATLDADPAATSIEMSNQLMMQASCTATINGNMHPFTPGIRMAAFASAFGDHAVVHTPCASDYGPALADIAARIQRVMGPCLDSTIDTTDRDASMPGVQLGCTATEDGATLPACAMSDATTPDRSSPEPCVWYAADSTCTGSGLAVRVAGGTGSPLRVTCPLAAH